MGATHWGFSSLWELQAQLCWLQEKLCQHLTNSSPYLVPSSVACALPVPRLGDDNHIRHGAGLIRLGILDESCNPMAELGVRLGIPASTRC